MKEESTNYYPNKSKIDFIDDLYPSNYGSYYNGKPFSGIKETITAQEYTRETFVNRRSHGIKFKKNDFFFQLLFIYIIKADTLFIYTEIISKLFPINFIPYTI